jgi:hypothetical protein
MAIFWISGSLSAAGGATCPVWDQDFGQKKIPTGFHQKRERQGLEQGQDNTRTTPGQRKDRP